MLTSAIQSLLLETSIDPADSMQDIVIDAQEYGMECLVEMVTPKLSVEDIIELDGMIEDDKSIAELDIWLSNRVENYESYVAQAVEEVKKYLSDSGDEEEDEEPIEE